MTQSYIKFYPSSKLEALSLLRAHLVAVGHFGYLSLLQFLSHQEIFSPYVPDETGINCSKDSRKEANAN